MSRRTATTVLCGLLAVLVSGVFGYLLGSASAPDADDARVAQAQAEAAAFEAALPKERQAAMKQATRRGLALGKRRGHQAGRATGTRKGIAAVEAREEEIATEEAEHAAEEVPLEDLTGPPPPGTTCPPAYVPLSTGECVYYTEYPGEDILPGL